MTLFPVTKGPLVFEDLALDLFTNTVRRGDEEIRLRQTEAEVLYILCACAPHQATLFHFDVGLYGHLDAPDDLAKIVSWHVFNVRKKLAHLGVHIVGAANCNYRLTLQPIEKKAAA